jgi:hypothetical protein
MKDRGGRASPPARTSQPHGRPVPLVLSRDALVTQMVEAEDELDFRFAVALSDQAEREAALSEIRARIAGVDARLDQIKARLEDLR